MRRTAPAFLATAVACGLFAVAGCASDKQGSTADDSGATPDGSFCSLLIAFRASNDSLGTEVNSDDTDRAKSAVTRLVNQAELLRKKAPADIKPDVDDVAAYVTSLDQLLAEYAYDIDAFVGNEEASAKFLALTTDEVDSSLRQLRNYAETECAAENGSATSTTVA